VRYSDIWPRYAKFWDSMTINSGRLAEFEADAKYAILHKAVYQELESKTRVPWTMIAVIHRREGNGDFGTYLGNGQSLGRRTTEVPAGRGPFGGQNAFVDGGVDAINVEGWGAISDWRLEKQLYYCMLFNGAGYELRGLPSPYVWGGTNVQKPGKFVADFVFNASVMDSQPGCAPMLATIAKLDPTITFTRES
jgi:lysozyme family protein